MTGREKSDGRVVPEGTGNRARIAKRGGKAATDIERKRSTRLPGGTADQPKPHDTLGATVPAGDVTLESVVTYENLREAFRQVSVAGQPFRAEPMPPQSTSPGCHPTSVFSLRYRPWGKVILDNQHNSKVGDVQNH